MSDKPNKKTYSPTLHEKILRSRSYTSSISSYNPYKEKHNRSEQGRNMERTPINPPRSTGRNRGRGGKSPLPRNSLPITDSSQRPSGTLPKIINPKPSIPDPEAQSRTQEGDKINRILYRNENANSLEDLLGDSLHNNRNTSGSNPLLDFITVPQPIRNIDPNPSLLAELKRCREMIKQLTIQSQNNNSNSHQPQPLSFPSAMNHKNSENNNHNNNNNQKGTQVRNSIRNGARENNHDSEAQDLSDQDDSDQDSQVSRGHRRHRYRSKEKCLMDKWPIKFKGVDGNGSQFLKKVERLKLLYDYSDEMVFKNFHKVLEGQALDWYFIYGDEYPESNWSHLKIEFARVYKRRESDMCLISSMYGRKQGRETFEKFYNDVIEMNFSLKKPLPDEQIIEILRENMLDDMRQRIFTFETKDRTRFYHKANQAYFDVINMRDKRKPMTDFKPQKKIYELEFEDMPLNEVEEISAKLERWKKNRANLKCFNCQNSDHLLAQCPEPIERFFCFRCGLEGYATPKCPNCSLKGKRGAE